MTYRPLPAFVLRAPLLPVSTLGRAAAALRRHPLGQAALVLASASLATRAKPTPAAQQAVDRYARRAAFRPTPHGLWAGVAMGRLGSTTRIATGAAPHAHLTLGWGRAAALARALLEEPDVRAAVRVRHSPSLLRTADAAFWIAPGESVAQQRGADLDPLLARLLDATATWTPWPTARAAASDGGTAGDDDARDDLLLLLIDDGLLLHDLTPPLLGPPALTWLHDRLAELPTAAATRAALDTVAARMRDGDTPGAIAALRACPGDDREDVGVHGLLIHQPSAEPLLARAPVERAASLVPLLFRLQEALAAPAAERLAQPAVGEALQGVVEQFGAGALDLAALTGGDYGIAVGETRDAHAGDDGQRGDGNDDPFPDEADSGAPALTADPPAALVTLLLDRIMAATAAGAAEVDLSSDELVAALGEVGPTPPPTAELFITPCRPAPGARPGTDWLLGLHAPAGASWGRFAHALGQPLQRALHELAEAERTLIPDQEVLDVAFAPSPRLADLCTHPPVREQALALTSWPAPPLRALTPADLDLCADPGAPVALSLRARAARTGVAPTPLARVRSSTAPEGIYRLLVGWSLYRQHAPWALTLGPLARLAHLPRIAIDGFVVAPASWRVPATLSAAGKGRAGAALTRWRRQARLPRWVQVGQMDQLLPVDLARAGAHADLVGADRLWEIWPPLGRGVDDDGRRIEVVVALCRDLRDEPAAQRESRVAAARAAHQMGRVPPPQVRPAATGWLTFKLFGAEDRQDQLLSTLVHPAVIGALADGEIDGWFFLRYVEGIGPRPHLRLRVHATDDAPAAMAAFAHRLHAALAAALDTGALATVETAPYHPEQARLGDEAAVHAAHRIFESDSQLVCALLTSDDQGDTTHQLVRDFDALAAGCGLSRQARHALARDRRQALSAAASEARDAEYRARAPDLRRALDDDERSSPFTTHRARVAAACAPLSSAARLHLLPTLLHLAAVRLTGPHRPLESRATIFWERTLESLQKSPPRPKP